MSSPLNNHNPLFQKISQEELDKMYGCLNGIKRKFKSGETVCDFNRSAQRVGIILSGTVCMERTDFFGNVALLDRLEENDVFGEILSYSSADENEVLAVCEKDCEVIFIDHEKIIHPCSDVCSCHMLMTENLLNMITSKAQRLSLRVEVLSHRNIRARLMCFFSIEAKRIGSSKFTLPFSLSSLSSYICVDRSAMMRELTSMKKDGLVESDRRSITLL